MKLSKNTLYVIKYLQADVDWHYTVAGRISVNDPSLPAHYNKSVEYYEGLAWGKCCAIESLLTSHNVYKGYYVTDVGNGYVTNKYILPIR